MAVILVRNKSTQIELYLKMVNYDVCGAPKMPHQFPLRNQPIQPPKDSSCFCSVYSIHGLAIPLSTILQAFHFFSILFSQEASSSAPILKLSLSILLISTCFQNMKRFCAILHGTKPGREEFCDPYTGYGLMGLCTRLAQQSHTWTSCLQVGLVSENMILEKEEKQS